MNSAPTEFLDIRSVTANSAEKATKRREMLLKHVLETGDKRSRLPNRVGFRADPEAMMDARFVDDLLAEAHGQPGIFVTTEDPGSFEFAPSEALRTEAGELWTQLERPIRAIDPNRQALVLFGSVVWLTEDDGEGKKVRKPYHLIRLRRLRSNVERKGIPLELPATPVAVQSEATE